MCSLNGIIPSYLISVYYHDYSFSETHYLVRRLVRRLGGSMQRVRRDSSSGIDDKRLIPTIHIGRRRWRCVLTASGRESTVQRFGCAIEGELFVKLLYFAINSEDAFFNGLVPSALLCWAVDTVVGSAFDASGTLRPCLYRCAAGISLIPVKRIGQHHL